MLNLTDSQKIVASTLVKDCTQCGLRLSIDCFYKSKHGKHGVRGNCKVCANKEYTLWKQRGGTKIVNRNNNKYYYLNKNTVEYRYLRLKTGAKQREKEFTLSLDDFKTLWDQSCHYCGMNVTTAGIDRVDSNLGYVKGNMVRCCELCNRAKNTLSVEDFLGHCKRILDYNGLN